MENPFFDQPIINSPYCPPSRHWELDQDRQPTQKILECRRIAEFTAVYDIERNLHQVIDSCTLAGVH